jgi:hypothetical protein
MGLIYIYLTVFQTHEKQRKCCSVRSFLIMFDKMITYYLNKIKKLLEELSLKLISY